MAGAPQAAQGTPIDGDELLSRLQATFGAADYEPSALPAVAPAIEELTRKARVHIPDLVRVVEQDPVLAARVLKLSATEAGRDQAHNLQEAAMRLGTRRLRNVVLHAATDAKTSRTDEYGAALEAVRRHSMAVAHCARLVAANTAFDAEHAYLCGLLHDVGITGCLLCFHALREPPALQDLWDPIGDVHERAAGIVASSWSFPHEVRAVIGRHHGIHADGHEVPMVAMILVAEDMAVAAGVPFVPAGLRQYDGTAPSRVEAAQKTLGFDARRIDELTRRAEHQLRGAGWTT